MIYYGLERVGKYSHILKNKRLGLVTTVASVDRSLSSSVDILSSLFDVKALYSPEHGLRGDIADGQSDGRCHTGNSAYPEVRRQAGRRGRYSVFLKQCHEGWWWVELN
ncbi:MAG TPA: DUF1343 domain-containing protein [Spirochaetia bacterium]|nr:DUF1343 domain-containing protein [Spirochaetia bacterium]